MAGLVQQVIETVVLVGQVFAVENIPQEFFLRNSLGIIQKYDLNHLQCVGRRVISQGNRSAVLLYRKTAKHEYFQRCLSTLPSIHRIVFLCLHSARLLRKQTQLYLKSHKVIC